MKKKKKKGIRVWIVSVSPQKIAFTSGGCADFTELQDKTKLFEQPITTQCRNHARTSINWESDFMSHLFFFSSDTRLDGFRSIIGFSLKKILKRGFAK